MTNPKSSLKSMPPRPPTVASEPNFYTTGNLIWNLEKQPNLFPAAILPERAFGSATHWKLAAMSVIVIPVALLLAMIFGILATQSQPSKNAPTPLTIPLATPTPPTPERPSVVSSQAQARLACDASRPALTPILAALGQRLPNGFRAMDLRADISYSLLGNNGSPAPDPSPIRLPSRMTGTMTISGTVEAVAPNAKLPAAQQIMVSLFKQPARVEEPDSGTRQLFFQGVFAKTYTFPTNSTSPASQP